MYNKTIKVLAYTDYIVLVGTTTAVLKEADTNLCNAAKEMGLTIICKKTKCTKVTWPAN
jgi:hypothetical protein